MAIKQTITEVLFYVGSLVVIIGTIASAFI